MSENAHRLLLVEPEPVGQVEGVSLLVPVRVNHKLLIPNPDFLWPAVDGLESFTKLNKNYTR